MLKFEIDSNVRPDGFNVIKAVKPDQGLYEEFLKLKEHRDSILSSPVHRL